MFVGSIIHIRVNISSVNHSSERENFSKQFQHVARIIIYGGCAGSFVCKLICVLFYSDNVQIIFECYISFKQYSNYFFVFNSLRRTCFWPSTLRHRIIIDGKEA